MTEVHTSTIPVPGGPVGPAGPVDPGRADLLVPTRLPDPAAARRGNGLLRALGLLTLLGIGALVAWDVRRRGLWPLPPVIELSPYLLLVAPLLAGLGMLVGRRPPTWAGLLLGGGAWTALGAAWGGRWLFSEVREVLPGGEPAFRRFVEGFTWVPYAAVLGLGLVVAATVLVLRAHGSRMPCYTRSHRLAMIGAAVTALLGPLWVLALLPALGLGLRRPHRVAAVAWAGWALQGVAALTLAANGQIPATGLPAVILNPNPPTTLVFTLPLVAVAALAGILAALPQEACTDESAFEEFVETIR